MENSRPDNSSWYDKPTVRTKEFEVYVSISQTIEAEDEEHAREIVDSEIGRDWNVDHVEIE